MAEVRHPSAERRGLILAGVVLLTVAVVAGGYVAAQIVNVVTCHSDTSHQDMTPALARYCDGKLRWIAIGWPGVFVATGAVAAWATRWRWPLVLGGALGIAAAVSPIAVVYAID